MPSSAVQSPPAHPQAREMPLATTAETAWKPLYRVGASAALISAAIIPIAIVVFVAWPPPSFQPTPDAVIAWFKLFQDNTLLGLLSLDLLFMAGQLLFALVLLALYGALRRVNPALTAIALAFGLIGVAVYITANPTFSLLSLSHQYAAATTEPQRSSFVAAGQALLAIYQGTPFDVSYILGVVTTLIMAVVMLQSTIFSKGIASVGILLGALMLVPATAGTIGVVLSLVSLVPTVIWDILIARRLFQLGQGIV